MIVKFRNVGNSMSVTIPKEIVKNLKIVNGLEADVSENNGVIMVKPITKRATIKSLFAGYSGDYKPTEVDWGKRKGNEVWCFKGEI